MDQEFSWAPYELEWTPMIWGRNSHFQRFIIILGESYES